MEVALLTKVKGKGEDPSNLPKFGRSIRPEEEIKYLGKQVSKMDLDEIWQDYVGKHVSEKKSNPTDQRRLRVKTNKMKTAESKAKRQHSVQFSRQVSCYSDFHK
jgi:hypothetical protein